ncbi:MAG: peptide-methionine (S)-S-oxide reductase MsrA [Minisyncoccota bacterium]
METEDAIFAGGCFWCTEALFKSLRGVVSVTSGYSGGDTENPSYERVSSGATGHAEAIKIAFDPAIISYNDLLAVFFNTHDPTAFNRQGADIGTQYRSAIFYTNDSQKVAARRLIAGLTESKACDAPIITEVAPFTGFYPAESHHQNYYERNREAPYCEIIIEPKLEKLQGRFAELLKGEKQYTGRV